MLTKIKLLLGITTSEKDELINVLIELAEEDCKTFTHRETLDESFNPLLIKMVVQLYNKVGNEGLSGISFGGVSENFLSDYSDDVLTGLKRRRKLKTL
jgi:hypothetical protein